MFFYKNIDQVRLKMNQSGGAHIPFLFGVNYEMTEGFFIESPLVQDTVLFQIDDVGNKKISQSSVSDIFFTSFPLTYSDYRYKFDIVHQGLYRGDSFLANLTIKTKIATNLKIERIFELSSAPYSICIPDKFVCFSPERFVYIKDGFIYSNPMKGTIDANILDAERRILDDFKETGEHNTIVDLIRNDLSITASDVHVKKYRYIDRIKTKEKEILQVSSEIKGSLSPDYHARLGDIIFNMLPAGSISGAPKDATISLIRRAEGEDRGYYTGVFGYYDGSQLDSGVMIRFIEKEGDNLYYRSGGGITAYSKCEQEYNEVLNKIYLPFV